MPGAARQPQPVRCGQPALAAGLAITLSAPPRRGAARETLAELHLAPACPLCRYTEGLLQLLDCPALSLQQARQLVSTKREGGCACESEVRAQRRSSSSTTTSRCCSPGLPFAPALAAQVCASWGESWSAAAVVAATSPPAAAAAAAAAGAGVRCQRAQQAAGAAAPGGLQRQASTSRRPGVVSACSFRLAPLRGACLFSASGWL
jgi:hypothetical protein